ncbi:glutamate mutase L [Actinocrispum sp. NPDC049592]|uniref:glutamate mutase L n=1 Tax=Actinocrispum sp. NPDC049592 TaxID=3154835 RepID=UPI003419D77C
MTAPAERSRLMDIACVDVGSTWTKGALVSPEGDLLATAQTLTTPWNVLDGMETVLEEIGRRKDLLVCSSAGGGLRLAVVGQERLISAEAGYRVALSAGAKVVHVFAGYLEPPSIKALKESRPDVVLLVGGTNGGDDKALLHNAKAMERFRIRVPIVLAGNVEAQPRALAEMPRRTVVPTANVLPDVGDLDPQPARAAIREVFLDHVIGGKALSRGPTFRRLVKMVTPDAVLTGVSQLASEDAVLVVDVGGATTDVYSSVSTKDAGTSAVAMPGDMRTVEGDIGMRFSVKGIVAAAEADRLIKPGELRKEAERLAEEIDFTPQDEDQLAVDLRLGTLAAIVAIRRHLTLLEGRLGPKGAGLLILSGGVFRHADDLTSVITELRRDPVLRPVLRNAKVVVDHAYVLAPAGLLVNAGNPAAARRLLETVGRVDRLSPLG